MDKWQRQQDAFQNFLSEYREIRPSDELSKRNVKEEDNKLMQEKSWFQLAKDNIRKQCVAYIEMQTT